MTRPLTLVERLTEALAAAFIAADGRITVPHLAAVAARVVEAWLGEQRETVAEHLLIEAMDGDYLVAAGRNDGEDVPLNKARPSEVAWWATDAALAALRAGIGVEG